MSVAPKVSLVDAVQCTHTHTNIDWCAFSFLKKDLSLMEFLLAKCLWGGREKLPPKKLVAKFTVP